MAFHAKNYHTGYEVAAINRVSGERIFVAHVRGSKSRRALQNTIFRELTPGETRLDRINALTGRSEWTWAKKSSDGIVSGDWAVRFTDRTGLQIDQEGKGRSIYDEVAA